MSMLDTSRARRRTDKTHCRSLSKVNRCILSILTALLTLGLSACGGDQTEDLQSYIQQIKARQKSRIEPLPKPQEFEIFTYNDASLRDPFLPTQTIQAATKSTNSGLRPDMSREKDVLEQYALGSLKMVGILEKDGKRWALITAPDGTLYRTTLKRYVGQNNGEIIRITETKIELREIVQDGLGGWVKRNTTLAVND